MTVYELIVALQAVAGDGNAKVLFLETGDDGGQPISNVTFEEDTVFLIGE